MTNVADQWKTYATTRAYDSGEIVFNEGDPGDAMYIVASGQVTIIKNMSTDTPVTLGFRANGDLLGELSLLSEAPRSATALATEPTVLMAVPRETFWALMREDSEFRQMVMQTLIEALLSADKTRVSAAVSEKDLFVRLGTLSSENDQLAELMRLRAETINFIVHDLRNPLNLIKMSLAMMKSTTPDDPRREHFTAMATGGVTRMLTLVDALLDVEKLEEGNAHLDMASFDLEAVIADVIERGAPLAEACRVTLSADTPGKALNVTGDKLRLDRVITNLVDNAIKFVPPGGSVTVIAEKEEGGMRVAINDTGLGIPPDQRDRVFERFVQTDEGRKASGFGLGLAYCRSAITAHGGRIWAEEGDNGVGTKIVFTLPAKQR